MPQAKPPTPAKRKPWRVSMPMTAVAIAAAVGLGLWMAQRGGQAPDLTPPASPPQTQKPTIGTANNNTNSTSLPTTPTPATLSPAAMEVPQAEQELIFNWLTESETPQLAADAMLASWNKLSPSGKLAVSRHLVNLVADEKFEPVAGLMMDDTSSPEVREVIFADVLNRPDALKWPLMLRVLEQETNPLSSEARRMLGFLLGGDFKDDWAKWREQVQVQLLKRDEQPTDPAAVAPAQIRPPQQPQ